MGANISLQTVYGLDIEVLTCLVEVGSWRTGVVLVKLGVLRAVVTHRTDGGGDGTVHTVVTCHSQKSEVKL